MSNYKTANLKPETMQRLKEFAVGDESVDSAVQRLLDTQDAADVDDLRAVTATSEDLTKLRSDLLKRLDDIENRNSLEDRDFDDWFEPDYTQTIAEHIRRDLETGDDGSVQLEATEYEKIAREVVNLLERHG